MHRRFKFLCVCVLTQGVIKDLLSHGSASEVGESNFMPMTKKTGLL